MIFSQDRKTKNNYTGAWETPSSWDPSWASPQYNIDPFDVTIYGYITVSGSLSFTGTSDIIINDTLVIKGNLSLADNSDLTINNNAILIVRGNLTVNKHAEMIANGYFIVTGNIIKGGPNGEGSLTSNDNPVKVFIGGTIPPGLTDDNHKYPALDCTSPPTTPYSHSGCSYGDMTDIISDPIYPFFQSTCTIATLMSSDADNSFCAGTSVTFTAGGGTNYNFRVNEISVQNGASVTYTTTSLSNGNIVDVIVTGTCTVTSTGITNTVFALPVPAIAGPAAVCVGTTGNVYTTAAGMSNYLWTVSAGGTITAGGGAANNTVTVTWTTTGAKTVKVNYTNGNGCTATSQTTYNVTVNSLPAPTLAGPAAVCVGATGNVYTTAAGMSNYVWTVSAGGTITAGGGTGNNTVTVTWTTTGAKTVTVNYTNGNGCTATTSTTYNVTVNALPVPAIAGPATVCVGATGNVYTTAAGMSNYLWTVSAGGTITAGGGAANNTVTVTWTTTGAKTVTVNYTNGNGCTATTATTYNVTVNALPVPAIAGPAALCVGATGNVYTTAAGMSNYLWTVSAGGTITAGGGTANNTVTVTWTTTGAKTVTVNYTNGSGCTATVPTTYNVTVNPLPVPTLSGPAAICVGSTGNVYTTAAGMSNYLWTISAGGTITAGGDASNNSVTVTWTTTGAKTVTVNYANGSGCTATSPACYNVTINSLPVPTLAGPAAICIGAAGNVYITEDGMSNYLWTVSAGGTITAGGGPGNNTVTVTWTTTGAKTVTVNYTNGSGCTATNPANYNVTVNSLPVPTITGPTAVCVGTAGNVYTTEAGMSNYLWTLTAEGTITEGGGASNNVVTITWTTTGAKTVTVNYTIGSGCAAASPANYNVTVDALPVATASNNGPVCTGSALSLTAGPAGMTIYSWTGPNGFTSSLQNPSVSDKASFVMAGVYVLTATSAGGCTSAATTTVTVNENPVAFAGPDQELTFVFETQMAAELSPPETGEWSLISGSGLISAIHSPATLLTNLSIGENIFLWKVQNGSCKANDEVKITVFDLFIPSVITPDGDGKNDYFKISENIGKAELIIFNRWGNEEYRNSNYQNDWDGRNNSGAQLPYDTYFYILKLEKAGIRKGSVLILR